MVLFYFDKCLEVRAVMYDDILYRGVRVRTVAFPYHQKPSVYYSLQ